MYKNKLSGQAKGSEWESQLNFSDSDILWQQWEFVIKSAFLIKVPMY